MADGIFWEAAALARLPALLIYYPVFLIASAFIIKFRFLAWWDPSLICFDFFGLWCLMICWRWRVNFCQDESTQLGLGVKIYNCIGFSPHPATVATRIPLYTFLAKDPYKPLFAACCWVAGAGPIHTDIVQDGEHYLRGSFGWRVLY